MERSNKAKDVGFERSLISSIDDALDQVVQLLEAAGTNDYIGESVSQLDHALQCAYFAEQSGHSTEVILASLLHDIGHFASTIPQHHMADLGIVYHEWIGAKLALEFGFSAKVATLIGYHVHAKRYLAAKKTNYAARLSEASKRTLAFQGGVMTLDEMRVFEAHPYFKEILQVRINDEKGKETDLSVPSIDYYRARMKDHFMRQSKIEKSFDPPLTHFVNQVWAEQLQQFLDEASFI